MTCFRRFRFPFGRQRPKGKEGRDNKVSEDPVSSPSRQQRHIPLFRRYIAELRIPPFQIEEVDGRLIDIPDSFCAEPFGLCLLIKLLLLGSTFSIFLEGLLAMRPKYFYFAYLSHWSLIITMAYFALSIYNTLRPPIVTGKNDATRLVKITWALFAIAAPAELLGTLLYWTIEFEKHNDLSYRIFMVHGAFMLLLFIEGFCLNRIPIRISQQRFFFGFLGLYLIWLLLHDYLNIGDPTSQDDDGIYQSYRWMNQPSKTGIITAVIIVLLAPLTFALVWLLSLWSPPSSFNGNNRRFLSSRQAREAFISPIV